MPYKKYARRGKKPYAKRSAKTSRRNFKRKFKSGYTRRSVSRVGFASDPFPLTKNAVLTYCDNFYALNQSIANIPVNVAYNGNAAYDPDVEESGSQPRYFDTFCGAIGTTAPYKNYRVLASKIRVTFIPDPTLTSANNLMQFYLWPMDSSNVPANPVSAQQASEIPYCKSLIMGNTGAAYARTLSQFCKTRWIYGKIDPTDDAYGSIFSTNPAKVWQWYLGIQNVQPTGVAKSLVRVQIKYYVQFYNRNIVATS